MEKIHRLFILLVLSSYSIESAAWDLTLRDKSKEPPKAENGAMLNYTNPKEGDSSYKIDAALNITKKNRNFNEFFSHNFALEFHKNTQTDKEIDTQELSYTYGIRLLYDNDELMAYHYFPVKIAYKIDNVKGTESTVASVYYYPELQTNDAASVLNIGKDIFIGEYEEGGVHPARINWQPFFGLSREDVIQSTVLDKGDVTRFSAGVNVTLNLMKDRIIKGQDDKVKYIDTLIFSVSYQYWNDLSKDEETFGTDDTHSMKKYKISYPLDLEGKFKIYAAYVDGEDPVKGQLKQEYSEIGLEFKIDI